MERRVPAAAIWALGTTQVIGYGSLYYAFGVLAPAIGADFGWPPEWVFGALSIALLSGGLFAPLAGQLADRFGAARVMVIGSVVTAAMLAAAAVAPNGIAFAMALVAMEVASTFVLYSTAFAALVQLGGRGAQRSITHLTLIAGFASTLFWPLTVWLQSVWGWRETYLIFALLSLAVCLPLHVWLMRITPRGTAADEGSIKPEVAAVAQVQPSLRGRVFGLLMLGFAIEGFILSGILLQLVPLLGALGLGGSAILVTTLFGPAQVLSRLINMMLGGGLRQTHLGIIAALLLPLGVAALAATAPSAAGAVAFAILFGLGSGLTSIVSGSLPLELFGRERYGARLGWLSAARQVMSAIAPFVFAVLLGWLGAAPALLAIVACGVLSTLTFAAVAVLARKRRASAPVGNSGEPHALPSGAGPLG